MLVRINHCVGFRLHCLVESPLFGPECLADGLWWGMVSGVSCVGFVFCLFVIYELGSYYWGEF